MVSKVLRSLIILSSFIWGITGFLNAQVHIDLFTTFGYGPFRQSNMVAFPPKSEDHVQIRGIPDEVIEHLIVVHNFQPFQLLHSRYLKGVANREYYEQGMAYFGVDSSYATDAEVDQQLVALVGSNQNGEIIVILDANNNEDFSDETKYIFPPLDSLKQLKKQKEPFSRPFQQIEYEFFNGEEIEQRSVIVTFSPYKANVTIRSDNPLQKKYYLEFSIPLHRQGNVTLHSRKYEIAISNGFFGEDYGLQGRYVPKVIMWESDSVWKRQQDGIIPYKIGETFTLSNLQYKFTEIDKWGNSVELKFIGESDRPIGYRVNLFAPNFEKPSISEEIISLESFSGNYVLLDFWGTWCGPCVDGIPDLKEIQRKYSPKGLKIISVAARERSLTKVKNFIKENEMNWLHICELQAIEQSDLVTHKFRISTYPTFIFIDPEGRILLRTSSIKNLKNFLTNIYS